MSDHGEELDIGSSEKVVSARCRAAAEVAIIGKDVDPDERLGGLRQLTTSPFAGDDRLTTRCRVKE